MSVYAFELPSPGEITVFSSSISEPVGFVLHAEALTLRVDIVFLKIALVDIDTNTHTHTAEPGNRVGKTNPRRGNEQL